MSQRIPMRRCCACRNTSPKNELFRVVLGKDKAPIPDVAQKINSRGAYICRSMICIETAKKRHSIERAFGIDDAGNLYEKLKSEV